ncbi:MAG: DNA polymerase III subunit delta [Desulfobacteraceae bacterium]|nr:DNA polymerase III subunit delta [Desulfobacteraceae bacterium]
MQSRQTSGKPSDSAKVDTVYLFIGNSAYLMEEAWRRLLAKTAHGASKGRGIERFQAKEIPAGQVMERLATIPMFGPKKVVIVENVESWPKEDRAVIEAFIPRIPPSGCLVMTSPGKKGIEGIAKAVEARGKVLQFRAPGEKEAPRWLAQKARECGKALSPRAAFLLVETVGEDYQSLSSELEKVITYIGERETIEPEDVLEAASSQRSFSMFDLLDQVKARQPGRAIQLLRSILLGGEPPLKVLSSLAWQIRMLWRVKDGLRAGLSEGEISARLKMHSFAVQKACEQSARFSDAELHALLDGLRQADVAIKSTGSSPEAILEGLLVDMCLQKKKPAGRGPGALRSYLQPEGKPRD